jgi:hypothetical protein
MRSCLLLLVERGPGTAELRLRLVDLLDEAGDEGGLGVEQRQPVVLFDQEDGIEAPGERVVDPGADLVACLGERFGSPGEQRGGSRVSSTSGSGARGCG